MNKPYIHWVKATKRIAGTKDVEATRLHSFIGSSKEDGSVACYWHKEKDYTAMRIGGKWYLTGSWHFA